MATGSGYFSKSFGNWLPDDPTDCDKWTDDEKLDSGDYARCEDCEEVFEIENELHTCADDLRRCEHCRDEFERENNHLALEVL